MTNEASQKPKRKRTFLRLVLVIFAGILLTCCGLSTLGAIFGDSTDSSSEDLTEASSIKEESVDTVEDEEKAESENPLPTNTPEPTNTSEPIASITHISTSDYPSTNNNVYFLGEIVNDGDITVREPEIRITLYDEEGNVLVTDSTRAEVPYVINLWNIGLLYPDEFASYKLLIDDPGEYSSWEIDINYEEASKSDMSNRCLDFIISNDTGREINDLLYNYRVSGEIENAGDEDCGPIRFSVTLYDVDGNVVGSENYVAEDDPTVSGESYPFSIELYARGEVDSYSLLTRGIKK